MNTVESARILARIIHRKQKYGNNKKFDVHLKHVSKVGKRYQVDDVVATSIWLHDSLEDQPNKISYTDIKIIYGEEIANIVWNVTDELGKNRKERKTKTYLKLKDSCNRSKQTKLCDRIANIEASIKMSTKRDIGKCNMYYEEFQDFLNAVKPNYDLDHSDKTFNMIKDYCLLIDKIDKKLNK